MAQRLGRHIVLGMAGHIDHGKTELVKALTGTDTDRLKEEKERGMTTDLGFAFLGDDITIIDVPGHEKFVKTMVAGVNTVDLAMLVIAADDGVMPQTEEHLEILNLLQVPAGLVAVSKIDLVEPDWLELVIDEIKKGLKGTFLESAPIVPVSPITGDGMDDLKNTIFDTAKTIQNRKDKGVFRLPIDRVFTMKGFGTVVAGTVLSGKISTDDTVDLLPQEKSLRVRGVQVHGKPVDESTIGFRTAINLMNVDKESIERGHVLTEPGFYRPSSMIDTYFTHLSSAQKEMKNRARVHVHIGTSEVIARIILLDRKTYAPGDSGFVQIHFEKPVAGDIGDRFVVRSYSPVRTIGGGLILDFHPAKHKPFQDDVLDRLKKLKDSDPAMVVLEHLRKSWFTPQSNDDLTKILGLTKETLQQRLEELESRNDVIRIGKKRWMTRENHDILKRKIISQLEIFYDQNPFRIAMAGAELRSRIKLPVDRILFDSVVADLESAGQLSIAGSQIKLKGRRVKLTPELETLKADIEKAMLDDPVNPPDKKNLIQKFGKNTEDILSFLIESGTIVIFEEGLMYHQEALDKIKADIKKLLLGKGQATVSEIRQYLGTTRKYAVPLLIYLDNQGFTVRDGDYRKLVEH